MSTTSDQDSDSSSRSPQAFYCYGSPSQQVPQLTSNFNNLINYFDNDQKTGNKPFLRITEQPQDYFRFRYPSEMAGTHGCLLAKSSSTSKNKVHPTVELMNYTGQAIIKCQLARHKTHEEHPHRLLEEDHESDDREVSCIVPKEGSYTVRFCGMGIIHTAKKHVPGLLFKKFGEKFKNMNAKELKIHCENMAKDIDLNIVRLKFSAHDNETNVEICPPVFSEPIHNLKSAASNDLKICRISRCSGSPSGKEDVYIFVEKVNKKNIEIRFFELDESGNRVWTAKGSFIPTDVHHQYAIAFRTPAYINQKISKNVIVYIELFRPSDGRNSEPTKFTYIAEPTYSNSKKRKLNTSSGSSCSSGSINSITDLPVVIAENNINMENIDISHIQIPVASTSPGYDLGDALMHAESAAESAAGVRKLNHDAMWNPVVPATTATATIPNLQLNSTEFEKLISTIPPEERGDFTEYALSSFDSFPDVDDDPNGFKFLRTLQMMQTDSAQKKKVVKPLPKKEVLIKESKQSAQNEPDVKDFNEQAYYSLEDGKTVKQLLQDLNEMIQNKKVKKQDLKDKLKKLFDIRLCNGDTYLHMILKSDEPSIVNMVTIIDKVKMNELLDYYNDEKQTLLHIAIAKDLPHIVTLLVSKGCDVTMSDRAGDTVLHYAAKSQNCLEPLLDAVNKNDKKLNLDVYNNEKLAPIHVATESNVRILLKNGASHSIGDVHGRTALHLAAYDDNLAAVAALLHYIPTDQVDVTNDSGHTALQIVCGGPLRQNSAEIVKLLLAKKADPNLHGANNESAWKMTANKPELRALLEKFALESGLTSNGTTSELDEDIKSEPEDDFDSADEGEETSGGVTLEGLSQYSGEVCALLDGAGAWQELAGRLRLDALLSWYCEQPSPTHTLLLHLKECNEISSKSLALILEDMGQFEAAMIIKRYIS